MEPQIRTKPTVLGSLISAMMHDFYALSSFSLAFDDANIAIIMQFSKT